MVYNKERKKKKFFPFQKYSYVKKKSNYFLYKWSWTRQFN